MVQMDLKKSKPRILPWCAEDVYQIAKCKIESIFRELFQNKTRDNPHTNFRDTAKDLVQYF
jgi:hypothetical protein